MTVSLLQTIYNDETDLLNKTNDLIKSGVNLNKITQYGESALRVASNNGRFDVVKLLLDSGADKHQLCWSDSFFEVVYGTVDSLKKSIIEKNDLEEKDYWDRTPFLLSIQVGDIQKSSLLLELGANPKAKGRCDKILMAYAITNNHVEIIKWLFDQGFDIEETDQFLYTALLTACELGKIDCVKCLIDLGADIHKQNHIPEKAIKLASNLEIVNLLVSLGEDINEIDEDVHAQLLGIECDGTPNVSKKEYKKGKTRKFGRTNPELVKVKFWQEMIKTGASAWRARDMFSDTNIRKSSPVWCFNRYGKSTTILENGNIVVIAGEHEDSYDPDFCIYNDVVVFKENNHFDIYSYPEKVFPPTDFHTATLVGNHIYIIGNLGYIDSRSDGFTPVYCLDLLTMKIKEIKTTGQMPGWISRHKASLTEDSKIIIKSGEKLSNDDYVDNKNVFQLCLTSLVWKRNN